MIVYFHAVSSNRFLATTHLQYLVLKTAIGNFYALFECVFSQELFAVFFDGTVLDIVHCGLDILACLFTCHGGVAEQTIDEALFDECEISSQTWFTNQALCLLVLDVLTNLLTHVYNLWVLHFALQTLVDIGNEVLCELTCRVHEQYIASHLVAIEITKSIVDTVALVGEGDSLHLVNAFGFYHFAWLDAIVEHRCCLILCLEVVACLFCLHHSSVMAQTVYQTLEENLLVDSPCWVVCQTCLFSALDSHTDVLTDIACLAQLLNCAIVTALERINKLGNGLHRGIVAELIHFHLCTVH